jgi:hypothetical protein
VALVESGLTRVYRAGTGETRNTTSLNRRACDIYEEIENGENSLVWNDFQLADEAPSCPVGVVISAYYS